MGDKIFEIIKGADGGLAVFASRRINWYNFNARFLFPNTPDRYEILEVIFALRAKELNCGRQDKD